MADDALSEDVRDPVNIEVGQRLRRVRMAVGYGERKRVQFAEVMGFPATNIAKYEQGVRAVDREYLRALRTRFGVTADYLMFGDVSGLRHDLAAKLLELAQSEEG